MTQMTGVPAVGRVGYRDLAVWFGPLIWLVMLGYRWVLVPDLRVTWPLVVSIVGIVLLETNATLVGWRSMRGLSLAADGITWHKHEMFLPWSNVAAVELAEGKGGPRLVVRVVEADHVLEGESRLGRWEARYNLKRYDAPIALKAGRLAVPPARVIDEAERLRGDYAAVGGFAAFTTNPAWAGRERAARSARVWTAIGGVGVVLALLGSFLSGSANSHAHAPAPAALTFAFESRGGAGFIDQTLTIANPAKTAVAPTLEFVALDSDGRPLPVTVRTAFGSDHGLVVVPPRSTAYDVLAFDGPARRKVAGVRATAITQERAKSPTKDVGELHAERSDGSENPVEPLKPFTDLIVTNSNFTPLSVRVVCIIWEQPPPGSPQQMLEAIPIGALTKINPLGQTTIALSGPAKDHPERCGSIKLYLSQ